MAGNSAGCSTATGPVEKSFGFLVIRKSASTPAAAAICTASSKSFQP